MLPAPSSDRRHELLELSYRYVLKHGLTDLSLRPLAKAVHSSPRVLLFLFGSKDGLIRALLARARQDELELIAEIGRVADASLAVIVDRIWEWLSAREHRGLLVLWAESYVRSLIEPTGVWSGFAAATVADWLELLGESQPPDLRAHAVGEAQRTLILAALRGALLDLLATNDRRRTTAAVQLAVRQALTASGQPEISD